MIKINNLQYHYANAETPALDGISLFVKTQSLFGLLGPNGAGKTTLLSILSGLLPCPKNTIFIDGIDYARAPAKLKSAIALVPQEYAFYSALTVKENLKFFAGILSIATKQAQIRIDEVVVITSLHEHLSVRTQHLSGGLKRRLNMAIGLLNKPRLLFLDEPTVGIDPHSRRFILEAIKSINQQGTTIIYTSHYMEEVEYLCDDIAIIDDGSVICQGALQELLGASTPVVSGEGQLVVDLGKVLSKSLLLEMQQQLAVTQNESSLRINLQNKSHIYESLSWLEKHQVGITGIHYGARNLEELFLTLTQRSLRD